MTQAAVLRQQGGTLAIEDVTLDALRPDELRVRIVACGVCHTDLEAIEGNLPPPAPAVFGHEGAGIVEDVGAQVTHVVPGDHVVLSFPHCGHCAACRSGDPVLCPQIIPLAVSGTRQDGSPTMRDASGEPVNAAFFGQSSFATHVITRAPNAVRIDPEVPLDLMAPLGCGIQTGAGAVLNSLRPAPGSSIAVFGAGAVGLAAVMASRIVGCERIVAVDRVASRLELAKRLGATETVDVTGQSIDETIAAVGEADATVEASGAAQATEVAIRSLAYHGRCILLGVAKPGTMINVSHDLLLNCRSVTGVMQGDADPARFIPLLVEHYRAGRLPLEEMVRFYDFADIAQAFADSAAGSTIKPVLRMPVA
jgi:aryl-alcohol dehydrogenase